MTVRKHNLISLLAWVLPLIVAHTNDDVMAVTIAENGAARATIVVAADASPSTRHAASELSRFLQQVTQASFATASEVKPGTPNILVGPGAPKMIDPTFSIAGLGQEGIIIRTAGDNLILAGGEPRGTLYAVYTFLEDYVGCRWWSPTASTIPRRPTLDIGELDVRYVPKVEYRDTSPWYVDPDFSVRNKMNGHSQRLFIDDGFHNVRQDEARGGRTLAYIRSDKWGAHGMWTLIEPEIYFADHPEWFALINGVRTRSAPNYAVSNLCLSNEEMRKEMVHNARLALRWNPHATILSIEQPDDAGPPERCECSDCRAIEEEEGSPSGLMVRFVNAVAEDLEYQFPDLTISMLAYHYTQKPPKHAKPRANVVVRLCNIKASFSHSLEDAVNKDFTDDLVGWSKLTDRVFVWYYLPNFSYYLPHPNLRTLAPNVKFLADHNVKGMYGETHPQPGMELAELRGWMWSKLLWNPDLDGQKLIEDFCAGYYGPAAGQHVLAYIGVMHDAVEKTHDHLGLGSPPDAKFLSFETLNEGWSHLKAAEAAVQDDPELVKRVQRAQLPTLYAFMMKWDELRAQSKAAVAAWPMPDSLEATHQSFLNIAATQGINISDFPMPTIAP